MVSSIPSTPKSLIWLFDKEKACINVTSSRSLSDAENFNESFDVEVTIGDSRLANTKSECINSFLTASETIA